MADHARADLDPWRVRRQRAGCSSSRFDNQPLLIVAAILTIYIVLGILYESYVHPSDDPLDPAVGGRRRGAGAADLQDANFSLIAMIGVILLIGIVKKNAIMMIDFAHGGRTQARALVARRDLQGLHDCAFARS